jgi:hypothetical protein
MEIGPNTLDFTQLFLVYFLTYCKTCRSHSLLKRTCTILATLPASLLFDPFKKSTEMEFNLGPDFWTCVVLWISRDTTLYESKLTFLTDINFIVEEIKLHN